MLDVHTPSTLPQGSPVLHAAFVTLTVAVAALFPAAVYWSGLRTGLEQARAGRQALMAGVVAALWVALSGAVAATGQLHFSPPPTMLVAFAATFAGAIGLACSPLGLRLALRLPLAALVGYQGFRVAVELLLHRAYVEGLMPVQMSYAGRNFDIASGITAIGVAVWLAAGGRSTRVVFAWNTLGTALLANILGVALLSAPTPFRVFTNEPSNVWITRAPWVWLPTVLVFAAVAGHALVYRRLLVEWRQGEECERESNRSGSPTLVRQP